MANNNQTILIIEYDNPTRELYQRELMRYYNVLACSNEKEALAILQNNLVDTIIFEPVMPSGQGWHFLAKLHSTFQTTNIPVILCTTLDQRRLGLELGAAEYLLKPVLPTELSASVRQLILLNPGNRQ